MDAISDSVTVALEGAEAVKAKLVMASGRLNVSGGAEGVMEATFAYSDPKWKPEVTYEVADGLGKLKVRAPHTDRPRRGDPEYVWDLRMGKDVPLSLSAKIASGSADLRMAQTRLSELDVKMASGPLTADLTGDQTDLTSVSVKSASGHTNLVMDGSYPVLDMIDLGSASGTIDVTLSGDYPVLKTLNIGSASGRLRVTLSGNYPAVENVSVKLASGSADLDLSGLSRPRGEISVGCVSGKATVTIAADVAAAIRFSAVSGKLVAPGFHKEGKEHVNDAYTAAAAEASAEGALRLSMSTVSGKLVVQSPEEA